MEKVQSADGTTIAYDRRGEGPALVMVPGAFCDRKSFRSLAACLEPDFTVYLYDRRGRGDSSDAGAYAVEREVEDLEAVVSAAGGAAYVFGHSSGAALALEAAAAGVDIRRLAAYEPPYAGEGGPTPELADDLRRLAASGHRDEAAALFLRTTGAPPQVIDMIKAGPDWPGMLAIAHTLPYDVTLCNGGVAPVDRLAKIPARTLALAGGASAGWAAEAARDDRGHGPGRVDAGPSRAGARCRRRRPRPGPARLLHVLSLDSGRCPSGRHRRTGRLSYDARVPGTTKVRSSKRWSGSPLCATTSTRASGSPTSRCSSCWVSARSRPPGPAPSPGSSPRTDWPS